jgi:hypothetical protein
MFPAFLRAAAAAAAPAVNAAVPDRAAGHDAGSRCDSGIRGIFTVRLATAWTWTGRCAATAGGLTGPGTPAAESSPTARDIVASIDTDGTIRRRR